MKYIYIYECIYNCIKLNSHILIVDKDQKIVIDVAVLSDNNIRKDYEKLKKYQA